LRGRHGVRDALRTLPAKQREAIVVAFIGGVSYAETAIRLGVPEGTVKTRIRVGLARLRETVPPAPADI
jgi:RNA polymerase sigma-70 factor (ECF subfamily)